MCNLASLVLTKNNVYYLSNSNSHEDIIEHFHLKDENIVRVELTPPDSFDDLTNIDLWTFKVDQDIYPDWTYKGDITLEEKSRKALPRLMTEQKIGYISKNGNDQRILTGDYSKNIVGDRSFAFSALRSVCIGGKNSVAVTTDHSLSLVGDLSIAFSNSYSHSVSGYCGSSVSGDCGVAEAGKYGNATAGNYGSASVGESGVARVSDKGKAKAGYNGYIAINFLDQNNRMRCAIGYIGEDGILPDTFYKVENGKLVPAD